MEVIPAIDVLGGRVVRLLAGDYERATIYGHDPGAIAASWIEEGATRIHLVDLAAARSGVTDLDLVRSIAGLGAEVQVGGGIRDAESARAALRAGAARVVVGTVAVHRPEVLIDLVEAIGGRRVIAAVDVKDGRARGRGWEDGGRETEAVIADSVAAGVAALLVTGIARDGTMAGPDLELLGAARRAAGGCELIASGGIAAVADLEAAAAAGADAAVVGRALLEGRLTLAEARSRFG